LPSLPVVDLYAGVGLFAVCAAAAGWEGVTAVEGDPVSAADLEVNASPYAACLTVLHEPVERTLGRGRIPPDPTLIVDPPRTGISKDALDGVVATRARRIVYVSCDVATLARDAKRFLEAGYVLGTVEAFDLFPNTAHVEVLTDFTLAP
jgi:23S rRNA (uracil1939-C5)-methyltransferase